MNRLQLSSVAGSAIDAPSLYPAARRRPQTVLACLALILLAAATAGAEVAPTVEPRVPIDGPAHDFAYRVLDPLWIPVKVGGAYANQGPGPITGGQVENLTDDHVTGAVEVVVPHPTNADVLWIGAVNGGIWRTDNATAASPTWTALGDSQPSTTVGALRLDPTDGTDPRTLVAGFGRTSAFGGRGGARSGLIRSTDDGATWSALAGFAGTSRNISGVAPRGATIVVAIDFAVPFFFSEIGIFRSTDTGASFLQISGAGGSGLPSGLSHTLASDPTDATRLFTDVEFAGASNGIYRSTDTGATWTKVSNAAIDALFAGDMVAEVEIVVGNAGGAGANVFVAICNDASGGLTGLFRSGDAGTTWTSLDLPMTTEAGGVMFGTHPGGQCGPHLSLAADPVDHDVVYIGGDRQPAFNEGAPGVQFPNSVGALNFTGRLFRVDAGLAPGSQAVPITHCSAALAGCGGSARTASSSAPHADSRDMAFDANGDLIEGDDGGVYRQNAPETNTGDWQSVNGNLGVNEQHDSLYDTISDIVLSGDQDVGSNQQTTPGTTTWSTLNQGDGGDVVVGENDPVVGQSTRYASSQNFGSPRRRVYDASNVLQSTVTPTLTPLGGDPMPTFPFTTPLAINNADPTRVILGGSNGVYESADRLDSVDQISTDLINTGGRNTIAYGTAGNNEVLYYGSGDDVFVRTAAAPAAPVSTDPSGASTDLIAGVVVDPDDATHAFAIDTNQVFETTDSGGSWTEVTGDLFTSFSPGVLRSITYVTTPGGGDGVLVGSDRGVYLARENDPLRGRKGVPTKADFMVWDSLGTGLPNAPIFELDYDPTDDVLLAGSLGRGAFSLTPVMTLVPVELMSFSIE